MKYQTLFTPIQIGKLTLKNRFAMAPMGPLGLGDSEGGWNQRGIDRGNNDTTYRQTENSGSQKPRP